MTEHFAAGLFLGLTAADFWELTPRQFHTLWKVYMASEERADRRAAMLACMYANVHRDDKKRSQPFTIDDFLPSHSPAPAGGMTAEQQWEMAKLITMELQNNRKVVRFGKK